MGCTLGKRNNGGNCSGKSTLIRLVQIALNAYPQSSRSEVSRLLQMSHIEHVRELIDRIHDYSILYPNLIDSTSLHGMKHRLAHGGELKDEIVASVKVYESTILSMPRLFSRTRNEHHKLERLHKLVVRFTSDDVAQEITDKDVLECVWRTRGIQCVNIYKHNVRFQWIEIPYQKLSHLVMKRKLEEQIDFRFAFFVIGAHALLAEYPVETTTLTSNTNYQFVARQLDLELGRLDSLLCDTMLMSKLVEFTVILNETYEQAIDDDVSSQLSIVFPDLKGKWSDYVAEKIQTILDSHLNDNSLMASIDDKPGGGGEKSKHSRKMPSSISLLRTCLLHTPIDTGTGIGLKANDLVQQVKKQQ